MRVALVLCAVVAVALGAAIPETEEFASKKYIYEEPTEPSVTLFSGTFFTLQDHTRPQNRDLFLFQYYANLDHYIPGGPFYIYIKDAGEYNTRWIEEGLMVDIATQTHGALFTFSQRYFGNNLVTSNATVEELQFLTIEQSLSDIAGFITAMRGAHNGPNAKVVVWGSGYGATLAAWARKRYPHLIDGAWSSSGIYEIQAFTFAQLDLLQYVLLANGGTECRNLIYQTFQILDYLVWAENGEYISERLNLCHPVDTTSTGDVGALFQSHINFIVQYIEQQHLNGVRNLCSDMNAIYGDALNSFARWKSFVFGHDLECFDHSYASLLAETQVTEFNQPGTDSGRRQWLYMVCSQIGLFSITDQLSWLPNHLSIEYHLIKCNEVFGEGYSAALLTLANGALRNEFGSLNQRVTNIIYTNGAIDPWLYNGMLATVDLNSTVVTIDYHAKSADLTSLSTFDPAVLDAAKRQVQAQVINWST